MLRLTPSVQDFGNGRTQETIWNILGDFVFGSKFYISIFWNNIIENMGVSISMTFYGYGYIEQLTRLIHIDTEYGGAPSHYLDQW